MKSGSQTSRHGPPRYIWTKEGWLYLAVVLDLFSRKVVGWAMDETMEKCLVMTALTMALKTRQPQEGLLHHSDRGSHGVARRYASLDYQKLLRDQQIICSMSRKATAMITLPWKASLLH
ncbi:integrase [Flammeovirgaceae bacterium 311]|nr:integrase [Flammeovirgaceae bacterium 311]